MTAPTEYTQMTYNSPDGAQMGNAATRLIGFFGVTPVTQPTASSQTTITATWTSVCNGTGYTFRTSDQIISFIAAVQQIQTVLTTLGLWKGS